MITYFEPQKPEEHEEPEHLDRLYDGPEEPEITPFTTDYRIRCWSLHDKIYPKETFWSYLDVYHNIEPTIHKYIDSLSVDYIVGRIRSFFEDDDQLRKFENVKQKLIDMVTEKYTLLVKTKRDQIVADLKNSVINKICQNMLDDTPYSITSLYQLHILYPLSQIEIAFSHEDYYGKNNDCNVRMP